jgi:hypothetical protein
MEIPGVCDRRKTELKGERKDPVLQQHEVAHTGKAITKRE